MGSWWIAVAALVAGGAPTPGRRSISTPVVPAPDTLAVTYVIRATLTDSSSAISFSLRLPAARERELCLPGEWAGRRDLYRNVEHLTVVTPGARLIPTADSSRVRVTTSRGSAVEVRWTVGYTPPSTSAPDAHNHSDIGPESAQVIGYDDLVLPDCDRSRPVHATFVFTGLAPDAPLVTSFGLRRSPADTVQHVRRGIGTLEEAVYLIGKSREAVRLTVHDSLGRALVIATRGHRGIPDDDLAEAVRRVVAAERGFWRDLPPPTYLVSIGVAGRGTLAGVRLQNAFVADLDPNRSLDAGVVTLFGHELMHEWIGGRLHAPEGAPDGAFAWFTEGFTDFEARRLLHRDGLISDSAYLAAINADLSDDALSPARDWPWQAVVDSFWRNGAAQRQPYLRGDLLAQRLDAELRSASRGSWSLDSALLHLAARGDAAVTADTLVALLSPFLAPAAVRAEIDQALAGGALELPAGAIASCATAEVDSARAWDPGFDVDASLRNRTVTGVRPGGPADRAGVKDGTRIVGASIWRGDPTKLLTLTLRTDSTRAVSWRPASDQLVGVQRWTAPPGCPLP